MSLDPDLEEQRSEFLQNLLLDCEEIESLILNLIKSNSPAHIQSGLLRRIHSIKGIAGSYELPLISTICHNFEDRLNELNLKERGLDKSIDQLLKHKDELYESVIAYRDQDTIKLKRIEERFSQPEKEIKSYQLRKADISQLKIFIIESSEIVSKIMTNTFVDETVQLSFAKDGYVALGRLLREKFDLIITNLHVASLNGMSLLNTLRFSDGPNTKTPFVIVSSKNPGGKSYPHQPDHWLNKDKKFAHNLLNFFHEKFGYQPKADQSEIQNIQLKHVLLVDDSSDIHLFVKTALKQSPSTKLSSAMNSDELFKILKSESPDLILLDNYLEDESGIDVYKELKHTPKAMDIPVIFLTGYSKEEERDTLLKLGAVDVLRKPFSISSLVPKIKESLARHFRPKKKAA